MSLPLCFSQHDSTLLSYCPLGIDRSTLANNSDDDGGGVGSGGGGHAEAGSCWAPGRSE